MNEKQAQDTITMLNAMWPRQAIEGPARDILEAKLLGVDYAAAKRAITRLYDTSKWMPSWAEIRELVAPPATSALEGFKKALMVTRVYSLDQRDQNAPDAVRATVARLGGWRVIGQMKTDEQQWNEKRWAAAWEEVHAEIAAGRPMAELLPAPRVLPKLQDADRNVFGEIMDRGATSKALAAMLGKGGE